MKMNQRQRSRNPRSRHRRGHRGFLLPPTELRRLARIIKLSLAPSASVMGMSLQNHHHSDHRRSPLRRHRNVPGHALQSDRSCAGLSAVTVTIFDDDTFIQLTSTVYSVGEDQTNMVIEVRADQYYRCSPGSIIIPPTSAPITPMPQPWPASITPPTFGTLVFTNGQGTNTIVIQSSMTALSRATRSFWCS